MDFELAVGPRGTPYLAVAAADENGPDLDLHFQYSASLLAFSGGQWAAVGQPSVATGRHNFDSEERFIGLALDRQGRPVLVFKRFWEVDATEVPWRIMALCFGC